MSKTPPPERRTSSSAGSSAKSPTSKEGALSASSIESMSVESCFTELEKIVAALEGQNASLEESLRLFERGMQISARCTAELARVEHRIKMIVENTKSGEIQTKDFAPTDDADIN